MFFTLADYEVGVSWDEPHHFCRDVEATKGCAHALAAHEQRLTSAEDLLVGEINQAPCSAAQRQCMTQANVGKLRKKLALGNHSLGT